MKKFTLLVLLLLVAAQLSYAKNRKLVMVEDSNTNVVAEQRSNEKVNVVEKSLDSEDEPDINNHHELPSLSVDLHDEFLAKFGWCLEAVMCIFDAFISKKLQSAAIRKCDDNAIEVLRCFDVRSKKFLIGGKSVPFVSNDISLIFGIPAGKQDISFKPTSKPLTPFVLRRFRNENKISRPVIEKQVAIAARGNRATDFEDLAKLLMLHLCVTLWFPVKGHTIGWSILNYIDDLDRVKEYRWPEAIWLTLMTSIEEKIDKPEDVTGCVIKLLYWLCEHLKIIESDGEHTYPRFVKWHLEDLSVALKDKAIRFTPANDVDEVELQMNEMEVELFVSDGTRCANLGDNVLSAKGTKNNCGLNCDDIVRKDVEENVDNVLKEELDDDCNKSAKDLFHAQIMEKMKADYEDKIRSLEATVNALQTNCDTKDQEIMELRAKIGMQEEEIISHKVHQVTQYFQDGCA
ncbi:hypothetical protein L1049_009287 [Liquidambar formosana]|uniref:Aminotransferase-like plant mobile domain-containing protein n=1 Tax=Liquidambar formosana TaxID=63359 RepID=A0AAP0X9W3_LIQFO